MRRSWKIHASSVDPPSLRRGATLKPARTATVHHPPTYRLIPSHAGSALLFYNLLIALLPSGNSRLRLRVSMGNPEGYRCFSIEEYPGSALKIGTERLLLPLLFHCFISLLTGHFAQFTDRNSESWVRNLVGTYGPVCTLHGPFRVRSDTYACLHMGCFIRLFFRVHGSMCTIQRPCTALLLKIKTYGRRIRVALGTDAT